MLRYDPTTALIVVDVQNDFADPAGSLSVREGDLMVPVVNAEIAKAVGAARRALHAGLAPRAHPALRPGRRDLAGALRGRNLGGPAPPEPGRGERPGGPKGDGRRGRVLGFSVRDPESGEVYDTVLHEMLQADGIERLVIGGLATDYCVLETSLDARMRGYRAA